MQTVQSWRFVVAEGGNTDIAESGMKLICGDGLGGSVILYQIKKGHHLWVESPASS